jgi:mannose/cellobiose epimerase-like protein (N-acyl-D-glucosamine 2-epimerase family)
MYHNHDVHLVGLAAETERLRTWLFDAALPVWWRIGADHSLGGFHERIGFDGRPLVLPRRSRVAARKAFCYSEAGRLGWPGPWRYAGRHALRFLRERFVQNDGTVISTVEGDGSVRDARFDLYNQAFALLAYACGYETLDTEGDWKSCAYALADTLTSKYAHPAGGFREDREGCLTLRSNPHMHLLESALIWTRIDRGTIWEKLADEIVTLCLERFIDGKTGALREFFATNWAPAADFEGEILEPGHHYEWAFLLDLWAKLTGRARPEAVSALIAFADANGIDRNREVANNRIRLNGVIDDGVARLWPQTERLRAYVVDRQNGDEARLSNAVKTLWRYLDAPFPGLWYENLAPDDKFIIEAAPSTSLYHIVGAIAAMWSAFGMQPLISIAGSK